MKTRFRNFQMIQQQNFFHTLSTFLLIEQAFVKLEVISGVLEKQMKKKCRKTLQHQQLRDSNNFDLQGEAKKYQVQFVINSSVEELITQLHQLLQPGNQEILLFIYNGTVLNSKRQHFINYNQTQGGI
ncbi:unnamed protein product [Paramecium octaurelia]|uniref:Uncharacterized protein n=1 Tax=Paramecium octaurelia TaxID=43137 RepID=A0A8S1S0I2_PAROT|nr:unnamed protein product [Paramecium octaurelia]